MPRTVIDIAGASPLDEGVMVGDAALRAGVPREVLEAAVETAGPRRALTRIRDVVRFSHPGGETDGDVKFLDPKMAPDGAGRRVVAEKRREDDVRMSLNSLARWGWTESRSMDRLRRVLLRVRVVAATPRATLADSAAKAREARPRFAPRDLRDPRAPQSG